MAFKKLNRRHQNSWCLGSFNYSKSARHIAVIFKDAMNDDHQVRNICKVAFFRIRNSCFLSNQAMLVHAFVISKLDNCNALLAGLPETLLDNVLRVHNAAALLVYRTHKYDRIRSVLKELH